MTRAAVAPLVCTLTAAAAGRMRHDRDAAEFAGFVQRFRAFDIDDQDCIAGWMRGEFPGMSYIPGKAPRVRDKREEAVEDLLLAIKGRHA